MRLSAEMSVLSYRGIEIRTTAMAPIGRFPEELRVENYTGYDFHFLGDWPAYVQQNNRGAFQFIEKNELGNGYGYILTTSSEEEFKNLDRQVRVRT